MATDNRVQRYESTVLPHLQAAYNLARWLTADSHDAEDVAQEAAIRAFRFLDGFRGGDPRAWLLTIVRNTAHSWIAKNRAAPLVVATVDEAPEPCRLSDPEAAVLQSAGVEEIRQALAGLPEECREILVLREMEQLSYKEIAQVAGVPIGTVMSRLARARQMLRKRLLEDPDRHEL